MSASATRRGFYVVALSMTLAGCALVESGSRDVATLTFEERCAQPAVVNCFGFDFQEKTDPFILPPHGLTEKRARIVTDVKASGAGSLRFEIPSNSSSDTSGAFWHNFSDDLSVQFGEREEFYVQWRQRFSPGFLNTTYEDGNGWKQMIVGEGDRPGKTVYSCTQLEVVVHNADQRGVPDMYHSCGGKDGQYEALEGQFRTVGYKPNQWMTFQVRIKVGTWYRNNRRYHRDSTIELWVAEEGRRSRRVVDQTRYDIANDNPSAKYGKIWLLPYHTGKNPRQRHPTAYTWYDELIISRAKIADPTR